MSENPNPLGMHLDFLFGRGFLWSKAERLSDWITLDHLRMEIPDLKFPFDAGGGLSRFRHTRCRSRELEMSVSEVGLGDLLRESCRDIEGFETLQIHFLDGAAHISVRVRAMGADTFLSFRAALIPPEPGHTDEVHLSLYDYRVFGPLPYPARLMGFELLSRLLNTDRLRPPGRGDAFTVGIAGDILSLRPLKLLLLYIFPKVGWKLPDLSSSNLAYARIRPGQFTIRLVSEAEAYPLKDDKSYDLSASSEGARALAAYQSKTLFRHGDQTLFDGDRQKAYEIYATLRSEFGPHPELLDRMLDCLLSAPSAASLAEAESICRELEQHESHELRALLVRPTIALLRGDDDVAEHYARLSEALRVRGDVHDFVLSELSRATLVQKTDPNAAAQILNDILKVAPRNRTTLERLREIYQSLGTMAGLEDVLKRLTGVYTDKSSLTETYLDLALHLIDKRGEVREARVFLERVLRLDPTNGKALDALGESYAMGGDPLRAVKAFSSAARVAESDGQLERAAQLLHRVSILWYESVGDIDQALLAARHSISLSKNLPSTRGTIEHRLFTASLCRSLERHDEAIGYLLDSVNDLEIRADDPTFRDALLQAHVDLAAVYWGRDRGDVAVLHDARALDLDPTRADILERMANHYAAVGQPESILTLYRETVKRVPNDASGADVHAKLGEVLAAMAVYDHAESSLKQALMLKADHEGARRALFALYVTTDRLNILQAAAEAFAKRMRGSTAQSMIYRDAARAVSRKSLEGATPLFVRAYDASPNDSETTQQVVLHLQQLAAAELAADQDLLRVGRHIHETDASETIRDRAFAALVELGDERKRSFGISVDDLDGRLDALLADDSTTAEMDEIDPTKAFSATEDEADPLEAFRSDIEDSKRTRFELPKVDALDAGSSLAKVLRKKVGEKRTQTVERELTLLRANDDPEALAAGLERQLNRENLEDELRLALTRELGELFYYELDDAERARPFLEAIRQRDPDGLGSQPGVLNALEAIYEESGDGAARIHLLAERLARAESAEMETVYRLLLCQTVWESNADRVAAELWLKPILDRDGHHEAANRVMAEIAEESDDFETAVRRYKNVLSVSPDGLDAIEVERRVAEILLHKMHDASGGLKHFRNVLKSAPGDSRALDGVKSAQTALQDWNGFSESLCYEFGLLVGQREPLTPQDVSLFEATAVSPAIRVPASQIVSDVAHVVESEFHDLHTAWRLWGLAFSLWGDQIDALERRILLDRQLDELDALAEDLESYADLLLRPADRYKTLVEAAHLHATKLASADRARPLYQAAIAMMDAETDRPEDFDVVRRALATLDDR